MTSNENQMLDKGMRIIWLIWGAILLSLLVYVIVSHLMDAAYLTQVDVDLPLSAIKVVLYSVSVMLLVASYFLRKFLIRQQSEKQMARYMENAARANSHPAVAKYTVVVLVVAALSESIGIFGFVLFLLAKDFQALYNFIVISAMALVYHRPRMEELQEIASTMRPAG